MICSKVTAEEGMQHLPPEEQERRRRFTVQALGFRSLETFSKRTEVVAGLISKPE